MSQMSSQDYMVRVGVSSNLDPEELETEISEALDKAGISNTVYELSEVEDGAQWTLAVRTRATNG